MTVWCLPGRAAGYGRGLAGGLRLFLLPGHLFLPPRSHPLRLAGWGGAAPAARCQRGGRRVRGGGALLQGRGGVSEAVHCSFLACQCDLTPTGNTMYDELSAILIKSCSIFCKKCRTLLAIRLTALGSVGLRPTAATARRPRKERPSTGRSCRGSCDSRR